MCVQVWYVFSSVTQSCPTLCDPMDCSMPGGSQSLLKLIWASLLSLWCHPAISSSVIPFSSCLQSFSASRSFPVKVFSHQVAKVLEFQPQHQSFQEYSRLISFRTHWFDLLAVQGTLGEPHLHPHQPLWVTPHDPGRPPPPECSGKNTSVRKNLATGTQVCPPPASEPQSGPVPTSRAGHWGTLGPRGNERS